MKYTCDIPGLEHNFVEISDVWSRGRILKFLSADNDNYLDILRPKILSLSFDREDGGEPITDPKTLTNDLLDEIDFRIFHWFKMIPRGHAENILNLGEASGRRSYVSVGETAARMNGSPQPS